LRPQYITLLFQLSPLFASFRYLCLVLSFALRPVDPRADTYFFFFQRVPRTPWRFARFCPLPCASNTVGFTHWACLVLCVSNTVVFYTVLAFFRVLRTPRVLHTRLALPRASDTTVSCTAFLTNDAPTFLPLCT
jgi:hypothetical protein